MLHQIFLSPKVKQCGSITYEHGINKLPQELPNDLRLITKVFNFHRMIA